MGHFWWRSQSWASIFRDITASPLEGTLGHSTSRLEPLLSVSAISCIPDFWSEKRCLKKWPPCTFWQFEKLFFLQIAYFFLDDTTGHCRSVPNLLFAFCHPLYSFLQLFMIFKYSNVSSNPFLTAKKRLLYLGTIPREAFRLTNHDALAVVTWLLCDWASPNRLLPAFTLFFRPFRGTELPDSIVPLLACSPV